MAKRSVPSEGAEAAIGRIRKTASYREGRFEQGTAPRPRLPHPRLGRLERIEYIVLPHVVAVAEEFSRRLLLRYSEGYLAGEHPIQVEARARAELKAESAWWTHIAAWKEWHGIELEKAPDFSKFHSFIEARNAIMHGLGSLTRRQMEGDGLRSLTGQLRKIGIGVEGTVLIFGKKSIQRCADVSSQFVLWLDERARTELPR